MIHFTNGDCAADPLAQSGVGGRIALAADVLHEGPCRAGLGRTAFRELRADYLSAAGYASRDDVVRGLADRDAAIEAARSEDEVVLWFEHDLFDQLNLIWLVDALHEAGVGCEQLRLVVIGSHPEVPRFHGLGQLSPAQFAALFPSRRPATPEGVNEARRAWAAVCEPAPPALARIVASPADSTLPREWPWLPGALRRLLEELPGADGLSRTERQGLEAIAAGAATLGDAFVASAAREERVFLGDLSFYAAMRRLSRALRPLLTIEPQDAPHDELHHARVALTRFGREVLAGEADHAAVNGLDRWVGGVHLAGTMPAWRYLGDGQLRPARDDAR